MALRSHQEMEIDDSPGLLERQLRVQVFIGARAVGSGSLTADSRLLSICEYVPALVMSPCRANYQSVP